jgi:hypothetical protein
MLLCYVAFYNRLERRYTTHVRTFFGTLMTYLRTFLATFIIVLCAFRSTFITELGAQSAHFFSVAAAQAHQLRCCITHRCAFHTQLNATGHHLYVFFLRARAGAMVTNSSTPQAGFNARLVLVIIASHNNLIFYSLEIIIILRSATFPHLLFLFAPVPRLVRGWQAGPLL